MKVKNYYLKFKISRNGRAEVSAFSLDKARKSLQEKIPVFFRGLTVHTDGIKMDVAPAKIISIKKESEQWNK